MKIKSFIKYSLVSLALILPLTVSAAQQPFCETRFDHTQRSPQGVSFSECDNGLGFPSFNAYRNSALYASGETVLRDDEWDFAQVLKKDSTGVIVDFENELGYKNSITLGDRERAFPFLYIHNSGNPTKNFINSDGSTPSNSVIAKNVRVRVDGFENIGGELISNQGTRHVFNAYLSSSNTTPRTIDDDFVINVAPGKALKLTPLNSAGQPAAQVKNCSDGRETRCTVDQSRRVSPQSLVDSDGISLSSYHRGSGGRGGYFFGSQGYRQYIFFQIEVVDAPIAVCSGFTVAPKLPGRTYRAGEEIGFNVTDVNPASYIDDLAFDFIEGTGSVRLSADGTMFYVTGWNSDSRLDVRVADNRPCRTIIDFEDYTTQQCDFLELFPNEPISSLQVGETTTLGISVGPESPYRRQIAKRHVGAGESTLSGNKRFITVTNWDRSTRVTAYVPGEGSQCEDPQYFNDALTCEDLSLEYSAADFARVHETGQLEVTAEVDPDGFEGTIVWEVRNAEYERRSAKTIFVTNINERTEIYAYVEGHKTKCEKNITFKDIAPRVCEYLAMSPDKYDYDQRGGRPQFTIDTVIPSSFEGPYTWTVKNESGSVTQTKTGTEKTFTPSFPLDGTQTVHVDVPDAKEKEVNICSDQSYSERPPVGDICPGFEIKRAARTTFGYRTAYCPANGSPIKLLLNGYGDYDTDVVWRANNTDVIITDGNQTRNGAVRTNISNPVIISGCDEGTTITVHLSDPDEYESNPGICRDVIKARDLPGDKPAEITKSVDKNFVSGIDVVTYTVRYRPLAGFFDGQFSTATILDNIAGGIQGVNPELGGIHGLISPIRGSQRVNLPPNTYDGSIYSQEGLTVQNADQIARANGEIVITYQAKVESALTEEICGSLQNFCGEEFVNTASDIYNLSASQKVTATCPFVLSRGFGDVFLQEGFDGLIDVASCSNRTSSEGPVFVPDETPIERNLINTGGEEINVAPHRICENSGIDSPLVPKQFGNVAKNFSSSVCESAVLQTAEYAAGEAEQSLLRGIARIARGNTNLNNVSTLSSLSESQLDTYPGNPNPKNKVYRKSDGNNLVIGSPGTTLEIDGGAKTIIVENANLVINSNLIYAQGSSDSVIAFVVIGGDIIIDKSVSDTVGIFATINKDGQGGSIMRFEKSSKLFTHTGSVFGDIQPLFKDQTVAGDLSRDRGTVTVRYDGRIVGNTPPGLEAVVEFNQFQTATGNSIYE